MQKSLRIRLRNILLALSMIPLSLVALLGIQQNISTQISQAVEQQNEVAKRVAIETQNYINNTVKSLQLLIEIYDINTLTQEEQVSLLRNTLSFSPVLETITITDADGNETAKVGRNQVFGPDDLQTISNTPAFLFQTKGGIYYGKLTFDVAGLPYMTISIPIVDLETENTTGFIIADLRFQAVWSLMRDAAQNFRSVYMTDLDGRIVAHNVPSTALKGLTYTPPQQGGLHEGLNENLAVLGRSEVYLADEVAFIVVTELPWNRALDTSIRFMKIAIVLILLTLIGIYFASRRFILSFTEPIEILVQTAEKISTGDLSAHVSLDTDDEISVLGDAFNRMANQLQELLSSLEARVIERTRELTSSLEENSRRAKQLTSIADAARTIAQLDDLDELLPNIAALVSESFGFYHVGIFLLDETKKYAILTAANSEGGQAMIARSHRLRIGKEGVVGFAVAEKRARIALDVGEDAVFFDNPELPNTHSEMALPLKIVQRVIGVLDIQSKEIGAFQEEDIEVLSTLADQIAVAIENARLFTQSQETLVELEHTFQQYVRTEWTRFVEVSKVKGYVAKQTGLEPIQAPLQKDDKAQNDNTSYRVPVKLRDVVVGHVTVDLEKPVTEYTDDELDIIHAAVERFTLTLENVRLLETTRHRARRESLVSEITTKIRSTNDPDEMVNTAIEELKRVLGATKVELQAYQPQKTAANPDKDA